MSLRVRTTVTICIFLISFVLISISIIYSESSRLLQNEAERYMKAQLERANENTKLLLNNIILETEKLSLDPEVNDFFKGKLTLEASNKNMQTLMESKIEKQPLYMDLFLVSPEGVILSSAMKEAIGIDISTRKYYKDTKKNKITTTSDIILSRADQTQIIITLTPSVSEGAIIGYTGIAIHAAYFSGFLDNFTVEDRSAYILIDSFDRIVSHTNKALISSKFDYFGEGENSFDDIETVVINKESYQVIEKKLNFNNWKIISFLKNSDIYSKSTELLYKFLALAIVFIIIAIIVGIYMIDIISKPIIHITESINKIIENENNFKSSMLQNIEFEALRDNNENPNDAAKLTEVSNLKKAIVGFTNILEHGSKNFDLEYNKLKKYIENLYTELETINNRNLDFITTLSHDIRTPLTLIKGYARGLESGEIENMAMKKKFESGIVKSVGNIEELVYDVLDFAYEVNFDSSYRMKSYKAEAVVKEILFELEALYSDKVNFIINGLNADASVFIDLMNIKRVLTNLINNSLKYTQPLDEISLSISYHTSHISFKVYDEGQGIKNEDKDKIFNMFYRTEESKEKKGYGLGLYISYKILKCHEIEIKCESEYKKYTQMSFEIMYV